MEVFAAFGEEVIQDGDTHALAGLASGKGDAAAGADVVGPCGGRCIGGAVGDGEGGGDGLIQYQIKRGGAGFFVNDQITHGQCGLLAAVDSAVAVDVGHFGVVINDGDGNDVVGNGHGGA